MFQPKVNIFVKVWVVSVIVKHPPHGVFVFIVVLFHSIFGKIRIAARADLGGRVQGMPGVQWVFHLFTTDLHQ